MRAFLIATIGFVLFVVAVKLFSTEPRNAGAGTSGATATLSGSEDDKALYALGVAPNGAAFVFRGRDIDGAYLADTWTINSSVPRLDPIEPGDSPTARLGAAMIVDLDRALLFGGQDDDGLLSDMWSFVGRRAGV